MNPAVPSLGIESVNSRLRIFVELALAMGFLGPGALAQKPSPGPPPSAPPSAPPNNSTIPPISQPRQTPEELVMFLTGQVATDDGTPVPHDVTIERVCNGSVRQQVHVSPRGDFSMKLGSMADSFLDASGDMHSDRASPYGGADRAPMGISRTGLVGCERRAPVGGFRSSVIHLAEFPPSFGGNINVGSILVQRGVKIEDTTVSATTYAAPKDARKAYEKGLEAERNGKLADARKYFEKAVEIYPKH